MPTTPDQTPHLDGGLIAAISGWVTAIVGFLFTSGKHAQRFEQLETKMERLEDVHEILAAVKTDIGWIKEKLK